MSGRSQHVTIPAEYRFTTAEVYIERDPRSGVITLSERPLSPPLDDIFAALDAAGGAGFTLERDLSAPPDSKWLQ